MKRIVGTVVCGVLAVVAVCVPFVALAHELGSSDVYAWQCATCVGTRTLPYWGPGAALLLVGVAFFLFVHEKPFPTLDDDQAEE